MANLLQKFIFQSRKFHVTIADADFGSLKFLHTLFDKYLDYKLVKFEQNVMGRNVQSFVFFDKND